MSDLFARAQSTVTVDVETQNPGQTIATNFSGLSFEMQYVLTNSNGSHFFSPRNAALIALFDQLGIKSLRVGGNTADRPSIPVPNEADADSLFAFAKVAGVKVIYTLRLDEGNLDAATRMANYLIRHYRNELAGFAIGNEPNVFSKTYPPYLAEWKRYAAQITAPANSPEAKFCGPSTSPGHERWAADFANEFGNRGPLAFVAQHDYPGGDARRATNAAAARDNILSPAIDEHYAKFAARFVPAILSNGLPYRLEEANSFYDGGAKDVSDTFASALWALDYQWWWAEHQASGINFHTGDKVATSETNKPCRYAVFWTVPGGYNVHPIGYALKMFSLAAHGSLLPVSIEDSDLNLRAYAATSGKNEVCLTLINREHGDSSRRAEIVMNPGLKKARARFMLLTCPENNVAAKTDVTLGGAEIHDNGTWRGKWTRLKSTADGKFVFDLPPATAALVQFAGSPPSIMSHTSGQ
ncbi:MAG TPA: hypothetical protein VH280_14970 [Verrucomicrobiae bacterium]|nr:hypothetical protein [Verrucomicrobiae bacterium]